MTTIRKTKAEIRKDFTDEMAKREIEEAAKRPIEIDEDCPELTADLIGTRFIPVKRRRESAG